MKTAVEWCAKVKADKEAKQLYQDPAYGIEGITSQLSLLKAETEAIFNTPPPKKEEPKPEAEAKPEDKKEEPKAEDKPAEEEAPKAEERQPDAEMKKE